MVKLQQLKVEQLKKEMEKLALNIRDNKAELQLRLRNALESNGQNEEATEFADEASEEVVKAAKQVVSTQVLLNNDFEAIWDEIHFCLRKGDNYQFRRNCLKLEIKPICCIPKFVMTCTIYKTATKN